jgi:hypothetical protein
MFLTSRCSVTKHAIGLDDFFEQHWIGFACDLYGRLTAQIIYGSGVPDLLFIFNVVIDEFFFVFSDSSFNFVHETIDRGVHVLFGVVSVDRTTIHMNCCLSFVTEFFNGQNTLDSTYSLSELVTST